MGGRGSSGKGRTWASVSSAWSARLSADERTAVNDYTGVEYSTINPALRSGQVPADLQTQVDLIDAAIAKAEPLREGLTLYRTLDQAGASQTSGLLELYQQSGSVIGATYKDAAFLSTTSDRKVAEKDFEGQVQLQIKVPAGVKGAAVKSVAVTKKEQEVLLGRNTTLKIVGERYNRKTGRLTLKAEIVP